MLSSPLILSLSTVFALIGIVLVAIAFGTDNWSEYTVNRREILNAVNKETTLKTQLNDQIVRNPLYFSRSFGLFRQCFTDAVPSDIGSYTSPLGGSCINIPDYMLFGDTSAARDAFNADQTTRMLVEKMSLIDPQICTILNPISIIADLMRMTVAFYVVGLAFLALCLFTGIAGCWRRSGSLILTTGILLLFAVLFLAASMALWHGVDYLEREVLDVPPFYRSWEPLLKQTTSFNYGWSYIVSWVGIGFVLISSLLMLAAYRAIKEEEAEEYEKKHGGGAYLMPNYYDSKSAMMPYAYGTYAGAGGGGAGYGAAYPAAYYGNYANGYYGYMTYGR